MYHSFIPPALRYIDQVARSGSIQAAARELNVAASAINRHVLQLEGELGVVLFDRLPRGMRLTVAGESIVTLARRWRDDEKRAIGDIRRMQGLNQGTVRLAIMDSHATSFMPSLIERLAVSHPMVALSCEVYNTEQATAALLAGKVDVAVLFNLSAQRESNVLWIAELPLGCVVAPEHPLASCESVDLQDAVAYPVALQSRSLAIRSFLEARHSLLFVESRGKLETNSLHLVKQLVLTGNYVAFTSEIDAAPELIKGALRFVPLRDRSADPQTISVATQGAKPMTTIVKLVADQLCVAVRECLAAVRKVRDLPERGLPGRGQS
jgi:DNA-binding transcriptional LysR family regulator